MLSKALVGGAYQKKLEALAARPELELVALVPPRWREPRVGTLELERRFTQGYRLDAIPIALNGRHHLHFYPGLRRRLRRERPDILHIDEESFNLATFLAMRSGLAAGARCCFFNWANIERTYPPPFNFFERYVLQHAAHAIAGNQEAAAIIRKHGYAGPISVLPQFGVDPALFTPTGRRRYPAAEQEPFIVGYVGRLVTEKGILDLLSAVAGLPGRVHLRFVGDGVLRARIEQQARTAGIAARVEVLPAVSSTAVPDVLRHIDVLVLPSHTTPNWKEQFGRVLIEAMSCGTPVIGSSAGEIPHVIGPAGLVVPERDSSALREAIRQLTTSAEAWTALSRRGRERVLEHYTQTALAQHYYEIYRAMHATPPAKTPV